MTYDRMEATPIAGEHCRFCGDTSAPLVKTPCCQQWICCDTAFMSFRGGGRCQYAHERFTLCYSHYGKPVRNAESSGHRKSTKRMRNIRSMCRDIEWWEGNEVQIPGNKIEPTWPFLDTLE